VLIRFYIKPSAHPLDCLTIPALLYKYRYRTTLYVSVIIVSCFNNLAFGEDNPSPQPGSSATTRVTAISSIELWLAGAIMIFGMIVLSMQFILMRRSEHTSVEDILRLFTVTIIIIGTLALIAVGYSSQQIAPALGLFGTILGYLLGKTDERRRVAQDRSNGSASVNAPKE
jgi:RsiW-degrading membrane proteinase PrsW (M82 family)